MTVAQDEMDALLPGAALRRMQAPLTTMDEVMRAYARIPMGKDDQLAVLNNLMVRVKQGRRVTPMPFEPANEYASREDYVRCLQVLAPKGVALVTAWDIEVGLIIVKTNAGKSFFGKQRAAYACFMDVGDDRVEAAGVVPTISQAFGLLDGFYQLAERMDRDLD